jgi:hypothetical protein
MKTGPDVVDTSGNESGSVKRVATPSVPPKMSLGAQNMKMGGDAFGTANNDSRSA